MSGDVQIVDAGDLRKYRTELPNLVDDLGLSVYAYRLYGHIKRVAGGAPGGVCREGVRRMAERCCMSKGMVTKARQELERAGLITSQQTTDAAGDPDVLRITVVDIWHRNFAAFSEGVSTTWTGVHAERRGGVHHMDGGVHVVGQKKEPSSGKNFSGKKEARSARPSLSVSAEMQQQGSPWRAHPSVRFWHQAFEARQLRLSEAAAKKVAQAVGDDERRRTAWESTVAIWQQHPSWHPQHVDRLLDRMESIVRGQDGAPVESGGTATSDQEEALAGLVSAMRGLVEAGQDVAFLRESVEADGFDWDAVLAEVAGGVTCK